MILLIIWLALIGLALYLIEKFVPMAEPIKLVIRVVVVIAVILWMLRLFGIADMPLPHLR